MRIMEIKSNFLIKKKQKKNRLTFLKIHISCKWNENRFFDISKENVFIDWGENPFRWKVGQEKNICLQS